MRTARRFSPLAWLGLTSLAAAAASPAFGAQFDPWKQPARYALEYTVDLASLPAAKSDRIRVWIPTPTTTPHQKLLASRVEAAWPHRETRDRYGNRFLYLEHGPGGAIAGKIVLHFVVERWPSHGLPASEAKAGSSADPQRYLHPDRLIPLDGVIHRIAEKQSKGIETPAAEARAFYAYVVRTMTYSKKGSGWGHGDAVWACTSKRGNCTDFHSLFIGLARSAKIPARFFIGFPIPADRTEGTIPGYHCWAEVFLPQRGWVPLDASEAKQSGRYAAYYGTLPSDRVEFTAGRDLTLVPKQDGPPVNYLIYPYVEVNGKPVHGVPWTLHFRRLPMKKVAHRD